MLINYSTLTAAAGASTECRTMLRCL